MPRTVDRPLRSHILTDCAYPSCQRLHGLQNCARSWHSLCNNDAQTAVFPCPLRNPSTFGRHTAAVSARAGRLPREEPRTTNCMSCPDRSQEEGRRPCSLDRNAHYWLWFLVFSLVLVAVGVVSSTGLTSESAWLLATGSGRFSAQASSRGASRGPMTCSSGCSSPSSGSSAVLHNLNVTLLTSSSSLAGGSGSSGDAATLLGLSLSLPYAMIHTVLGLSSLNLGLRANSSVPVAATPVAAS